jgi:transcriptional regulator with XRE-family HTH domain
MSEPQTRARVPEWSVADRLRKAREVAGMDQAELAERAGLSRATVSNAERGVGIPQRATLLVWALATGVDQDWLMQGVEAVRRKPGPKPRR